MRNESARGLDNTGEVEENFGLHGGEEGEPCDLSSLIEELRASDLAIRAPLDGASQNEFNKIHLLNHVLEGSNVRVRDLAALRDVAQRAEVFEQMVRQLVLGRLQNDALEIGRVNIDRKSVV